MKKQHPLKAKSHSKGIVLTPLLIFIALVVMSMGFIAVMSRNSSFWSSDELRAELDAAIVTKQVSELKAGYNNAVATGWDASKITLDEGATGLYNPTYNFAQKPVIPASVCATTNCKWEIFTNLKATDVIPEGIAGQHNSGSVKNGTQVTYFSVVQQGTTKDVMFVATGLKEATAQQLNKEIYVMDGRYVDGTVYAVPATTKVFSTFLFDPWMFNNSNTLLSCQGVATSANALQGYSEDPDMQPGTMQYRSSLEVIAVDRALCHVVLMYRCSWWSQYNCQPEPRVWGTWNPLSNVVQ